jgi:hypothetical protein
MQYLEDINQEQAGIPENWHFGHINRLKYEPWRAKARKLRKRRMKKIYYQEQKELHNYNNSSNLTTTV